VQHSSAEICQYLATSGKQPKATLETDLAQISPRAKFSKLLRNIFGRLLFQRKYADCQNFFEKSLWKKLKRSFEEDFEKGCTIFETSLETS